MTTRRKIFYLIICGIIVGIYIILSTLFIKSAQTPISLRPSITLTTPTAVPERRPTTIPPLEKIKNEGGKGLPLTKNELTSRSALISSADKFGYIHTDKDFSIVYIKDYDVFQIRLTSTNLTTAKQHALSWLEAEGFTHNGICKLPVFFYSSIHTGATISLDPGYCQ